MCALMVAGLKGGSLDPFVATINLTALFWDWIPFSQLNACTAFLLQVIYCQRAGIPVFGYMPVSRISGNWEGGEQGSGDVPYTFPETMANEDRGYSLDTTAIHLKLLELYHDYAEVLEGRVNDFRLYRRGVRVSAAGIDGLNDRQREVIVSVAMDPYSTTTIERHRESFGIAYSTARADLVSLAEMGFLTQKLHGQEHAYAIGKKLLPLLKGIAGGGE